MLRPYTIVLRLCTKPPARCRRYQERTATHDNTVALLCGVVFVDDAFFHDEEDVFDGADVLGWVAGDGDDVGELADFEGAGAVGDAEESGVGRRASLQRVDRFHSEVGHLVKFFSVAAVWDRRLRRCRGRC